MRMAKQLLTATDLTRKLRISISAVYRLTTRDGFPKPIVLNDRSHRWDEEAIDAWLTARAEQH